jgi:uncharacterized protein
VTPLPVRSDVTPWPQELGLILAQLTAAGTPWLALAPPAAAFPLQAGPLLAGTLQAAPPRTASLQPVPLQTVPLQTVPPQTVLPRIVPLQAGQPLTGPRRPSVSWPGDPVVIDVTDLRAAPLTVNPFEPEPGCAIAAHAERLAALFEAAFRPPGPVRASIRLALRRVYTNCGWDLATGAALPGAAGPPGIPSIGELRRATITAAADLGCDVAMRAAVRAFLDVKLQSLWSGQAGRFLAGGHPADVAGLLRGNVIFMARDVADDESAAFLTGVLLTRLAEQLRGRGPHPQRPAVVLAVPSGRLRRVLDEIRASGADVIPAVHGSDVPARTSEVPADDAGSVTLPFLRAESAPLPMLGRRSPGCGLQCRQRPCSGYELHEAGLRAGMDGQVWLRLWVQTLVLAFLTGNPLPHVPQPLRNTRAGLDARGRECLLATVVDDAVTARARALRYSYDPKRLTAVVASAAAGLLAAANPAATTSANQATHANQTPHANQATHAGQAAHANQAGQTAHAGHANQAHQATRPAPPLRAGHVWVIPQLRWLHEAERLDHAAQDDIAPPLDFELGGLVDWPGIRAGDRLEGLRRHRLSMEREENRALAVTALLGAEPTFDADLALAAIGQDKQQRLRYAARMLGTVWLEAVLSWPSRLIIPAREPGQAGAEAEVGTVPEAATG